MGVPVRVEDEAFSDPRLEVLGRLIGDDKFGAMGRMAYVWRYCTMKTTECVGTLILDVVAGVDGFARHLVTAGLGEAVSDNEVRIKGTAERIGWYVRVKANAALGGRAKAAKTLPDGMPTGSHEACQTACQEGCQEHAQSLPSPCLITITNTNNTRGTAADEPPPGFREAVDLYFRLYQKAAGCKPAFGKKDGAQLKALLKKHGQEQVARRLEHLFGPRCPAWLREGRDLGTLVANWNKLVPPMAQGEEPAFDPEAEKERRRRDDEELAKRVAEGRI